MPVAGATRSAAIVGKPERRPPGIHSKCRCWSTGYWPRPSGCSVLGPTPRCWRATPTRPCSPPGTAARTSPSPRRSRRSAGCAPRSRVGGEPAPSARMPYPTVSAPRSQARCRPPPKEIDPMFNNHPFLTSIVIEQRCRERLARSERERRVAEAIAGQAARRSRPQSSLAVRGTIVASWGADRRSQRRITPIRRSSTPRAGCRARPGRPA